MSAWVLITALQIIGAIFFVYDGFEDQVEAGGSIVSVDAAMECVIALALLSGIILSARRVTRMMRELHTKEQSLAKAKGALAAHIENRFREWGLTPGESDVALFALKGCDIAEIAALRGAAAGTVRAQLSQIYAKAEVTSQAMLVSSFIEDLLIVSPASDTVPDIDSGQ